MSHLIKTRFSPSPTGYMHLGNVRTALFGALFAKHAGGKFLLRIEDTDLVRSRPEWVDSLQEDLRWLGLYWDEGPYFQSERGNIYAQYYAYLEQQNMAYPCFCSDEDLALARKVQLSSGQPPRYAGTCLKLTSEEIAAKKAAGNHPALRFKVPLGQEVHFIDLVKGQQRFRTDDIGDFIIRRADGSASFFFCNAIDDAVMGVTHALRGEDHLTNTPRQILILTALGLPVPHYGHIALIVGDDGAPLSKRHGSKSLKELREDGYLPLAIHNYLGRLGHYYVATGLLDIEELAQYFSLAHLGTTPAHFDRGQLLYWQKLAVARLDNTAFWQWLGAKIHAEIPENKREAFVALVRPNTVLPPDAFFWSQILFKPLAKNTEMLAQNKVFMQSLLTLLHTDLADMNITPENCSAHYAILIKNLQEKLNLKGKALFQPLRMALTGQLHGPELSGICGILGREGIMSRLQQWLDA